MVTKMMLWRKKPKQTKKKNPTEIGEWVKSITLIVGINNSISYFTSDSEKKLRTLSPALQVKSLKIGLSVIIFSCNFFC